VHPFIFCVFCFLALFIIGEHFAAIYAACDHARWPRLLHVTAADWWRAMMVFAYMTGWRISEILALRRSELDLDAGTAVTRLEDNKGGRDDRVKLHTVAIEHLQKIPGFSESVFPWPLSTRALLDEWHRIQAAADIHLSCHREHEHTSACHFYGFHDLRRAFATQNAPRLTADALQKLMRHKSYATTQRYINMASQLDEAVETLHVPDVLRHKKANG
jgi:integrase